MQIQSKSMKSILLSIIILLIANDTYSQRFDMFDIDNSQFPKMHAKFLAFNALDSQLTNLSPSDFSIREEGNDRNIISVTCNSRIVLEPVSTVLVMDASGSMLGRYLELAKSAARAWIQALPKGQSECAIVAFNSTNHLIQDFTNDRLILNTKVNDLFASGGTNYNAALIDDNFGGLIMSRPRPFKKIIVMMTDGLPNFPPDESAIIGEALNQGAVIFAVTLGMPCPASLRNIATSTGGNYFENVSTREQADEIYRSILTVVQGAEACEIVWESDIACKEGERVADVEFYPLNVNRLLPYQLPSGLPPGVTLSTESVFFRNALPGTTRDTIITLTANSGSMNVSDIKFDNPAFDVYPRKFIIAKGQSMQLKISYTAPESPTFNWARMEIFNNLCPARFFVSAAYQPKMPEKSKLIVTHPNGGEVFLVGSDTLITWTGIPTSDTVRIEYSYDNGNTWKLISNKASGGSYYWKRIPKTISDVCLVKVTQISSSETSDPELAYRIGSDFINSIQGQFSGIKIDKFGNIYTATHFAGIINIGDKKINSVGEEDIIVTKHDSKGKLIWHRILGGQFSDYATGIDIDEFGNSYITGRFNKLISYDDRITYGRGGSDVFIAKLLPDGTVDWVRTPGGKGEDFGNSISLDKFGNIIVTGAYTGEAYFGDILLKSAGSNDIFIAKYASDGKMLWAKSNGGLYFDEGTSIDTDDSGNIFTTGKFSKEADFGSIKLTGAGTNPEFADYDIYVAKYTPGGILQWVEKAGGNGDDESYSIKVDFKGNPVISGYVYQRSNFGPHSVTPVPSGSANLTADMFVAKMDAQGQFIWAKSAGGKGNDFAYALEVDSSNRIHVAGTYYLDANFGKFNLKSKGFHDVSVAQYDTDGNILSVKSAGGLGTDMGMSIALDALGNHFIAGYFTQAGTFGTKILTTDIGLSDTYVWGAGGGRNDLQTDISDSLWAIVQPLINARNIDMGDVFVGSMSDTVVSDFIINISDFDCFIEKVILTGAEQSAFRMLTPITNTNIQGKSALSGSFEFRPFKTGNHSADLIIYTQSDTLYRNITGVGLVPELEIANTVIDFGKVPVGESKDTLNAASVVNKSSKIINILDTKYGPPNDKDFKTISGGGSITLGVGESAKLSLRFTPSIIGKTSGTLEFHYDVTGSPAIIQLLGEGVNPNPDINIANNILEDLFCQGNTESEITVSNNGSKDLIIDKLYFEGNNSDEFTIISSLPLTIKPFSSVNLTIKFNSVNPGFKTASLVAESNANPNALYKVPFTLNFNGVKASPDRDNIDFGVLNLNQPSTQNVIIRNTGNYAGYFVLNKLNNFITDKTAIYLLPNQSVGLDIIFSGSANEGSFSEKLVITDTLCKSISEIILKADVKQRIGPVLAANFKGFGILNCSSEKSEIFLVSNNGNETLLINSIKIEGDDSESFKIGNYDNTSILPGENEEIILEFIPLKTGLNKAELVIISNSEGNPEVRYSISGNYEITDYSVMDKNIDLGIVNQSDSKQSSFTVFNNGTVSNYFTFSTSDKIEISLPGINIGPGESAIIDFEWKSNATIGNYTESIMIVDEICNITDKIEINTVVIGKPRMTLNVLDAQAYTGDKINLHFEISDTESLEFIDVDKISFSLKYNSTMLYPDYDANLNISDGVGIIKIENIDFDKTKGFSLTLPFISGLGNSLESQLEIINFTTNNNLVGTNTNNGKFTSLGICLEGGARLYNHTEDGGIISITPNPADSDIMILLNLIESGITYLNIYDVNGVVTETISLDGVMGTTEILIPSKILSSGKYFISLITPSFRQTESFIIRK